MPATFAAGIRLGSEDLILEAKLRSDLNRTRIANSRHLTVVSGGDGGADRSKVRVVENIEELTTQLQAYSSILAKVHVLKEREVESHGWRSFNCSTTCVRHDVRNRRRRRVQLETLSIEPDFERIASARVRVTERDGPIAGNRGRDIAQAGTVKVRAQRTERQACLVGENA